MVVRRSLLILRPSALAFLLALLGAAAPVGGTLTIAVDNVRSAKGLVHVDLCTQETFLKDGCLLSRDVPAASGTTVVTLTGVPRGDFAVQATHDENGNHRVDRALFGIPKEGVGFSRDARVGLGPPKWADAVFSFDGEAMQIALKMRYFLGRSGPGTR